MTSLRLELEDLRAQSPAQVRLVLDHDRIWERILTQVDTVDGWTANSDAAPSRERDLRELAEGVRRIPSLVTDWQGPARAAFESTVTTLAHRIDVLADIGADHQSLDAVADGIRRETEAVIRDLVTSTVSHARRSLEAATHLAIISAGESLRHWVVSALILVRRTVNLVETCVRRAGELLERVENLTSVLVDNTRQVQAALDEITRRLG